MDHVDISVILIYAAGLLTVGFICSRNIRDSADMFIAGGEAPWWVSGLSAYMTMFSAGTFVVWGGIAYRSGMAGVSICVGNGVAAMLAGWMVAARWRTLGVTTAAEYFELRFGETAVRIYTVFNLLYKMVTIAVALYSVAVLLCALMPLEEGAWFRDATTGQLSVSWAIIFCGLLVVVYTIIGGLWAVLMTDVLQFLVLILCVMLVVPLSFANVGGCGAFLQKAPAGFFSPVTSEFTWWFLAGWVMIQFASIGGEWAFVQRFLCVPTPKDSRRGTYLFGILYLITPLFWMLPPMIYRVYDANADPEQAYILACQSVLPAGMVGLMIAAMFSATASMIDSQLNVFSGVLTHDFYARLWRPQATEKQLVAVGRWAVAALGAMLIAGALAVPWVGGAEQTALGIAALVIVPLMLPTVWGLFSRKIGRRSLWLTVAISFSASGAVKFGMRPGGLFETILPSGGYLQDWLAYAQTYFRTVETLVAVLIPLIVLAVCQLLISGTDTGWNRVAARKQAVFNEASAAATRLPALMIAWSLLGLGVLTAVLAVIDPTKKVVLVSAAAGLSCMSLLTFAWTSRLNKGQKNSERIEEKRGMGGL